jgi:hypothetical protein
MGFPNLRFPGKSRGVSFLVHGEAGDPKADVSLDEIGTVVRGCRFISSDPSHDSLGVAVESIGDFNGDGIDDLAISAPSPPLPEERTPGMDHRGQLFIVFGGEHLVGVMDVANISGRGMGIYVEGPNRGRTIHGVPYDLFAVRVRSLGDVNGDGMGDIVAWDARGAYILLGHRSDGAVIDLVDIAEGTVYDHVVMVTEPLSIGLSLGNIAGIGDMNGDGRSDIAMGLMRISISPSQVGRVYILYGRDDFPAVIDTNVVPLPEAGVTIWGLRSPDGFGGDVLSCGDINGDGFQDLGMAAWGDNREGEFTVLYGRRDFPSEVQLREPYSGIFCKGEVAGDHFASDAIACGDFNGDTVDDVAILSGFATGPDVDRLYILLGDNTNRAGLSLYGVNPSTGVQRGGTEVSIRGKGFTGETRVFFDGQALESATVVSEFEITGSSPPGAARGKVAVEVRRGADVASLPSGFEYTQNLPDYDVRDLAGNGLTLEGEIGLTGSRAFTFQSGSPLVFEDLNDDGVDELAVESTGTNGWYVTLVTGRPGLEGTHPAYESGPAVTLVRESDLHLGSTGKAGCYLAALGDVNDDGQKDLGIGTWDGLAFVLFGRSDLLSGEDIVLESEMTAGRASRIDLGVGGSGGQTVLCGLGDLDRNGIDEFAIGHSGDGGEIRIVEVGEEWSEVMGDLAPWTRATFWSGDPEIRIGQQVFNVGDVDGDSVDDLLLRSEVRNMRFVAFVVYGGSDFPERVEVSDWVASGGGVKIVVTDGFEHLPFAQVNRAGDVNGDGYRDVLIGIDGGGDIVTQGATYVLFGGSNLPVELEVAEDMPLPQGLTQVLGEGKTEQAGRVGPAGDFNDDGYDDFLIGGPGFQSLEQSGNVFLIYGAETLPQRIELRQLGGMGLKLDGQNVPGGAGFAVGPSGDLNGDGQDDFVFSEVGNQEQIARVYVIYGPFASKDFSRGDSNADGLLNIADAIGVLTFLFSGGRPPLCTDAADADDDGTVTITDPIRVLNYLFLGLDSPLPPFPEVGPDPSEDDLDCLLF